MNSISFHPIQGTFVTVGGENGQMAFWDHRSKTKLAYYPALNQIISTTAFNRNGEYLAYAKSYDWSKVKSRKEHSN